LGEWAGGLDYARVSKAIARFTRRLSEDSALQKQVAAIWRQLSNVKM
jgi:hypothetical protein